MVVRVLVGRLVVVRRLVAGRSMATTIAAVMTTAAENGMEPCTERGIGSSARVGCTIMRAADGDPRCQQEVAFASWATAPCATLLFASCRDGRQSAIKRRCRTASHYSRTILTPHTHTPSHPSHTPHRFQSLYSTSHTPHSPHTFLTPTLSLTNSHTPLTTPHAFPPRAQEAKALCDSGGSLYLFWVRPTPSPRMMRTYAQSTLHHPPYCSTTVPCLMRILLSC